MTMTRSKSKPGRPVTRSMSKPASSPVTRSSSKRVASVSKTRKPRGSAAKKQRRSRLMPLAILDPRVYYKGRDRDVSILIKQFLDAGEGIESSDSESSPEDIASDIADLIKPTPAYMHECHDMHSRKLTLEKQGVFYNSRPNRTKKTEKEYARNKDVAIVLKRVLQHSNLQHRDVISMLTVSTMVHDKLISFPSFWKALDFSGRSKAGEHLVEALSMPRYDFVVEHINLESAQGVENEHLKLVAPKSKECNTLIALRTLNLNCCQHISDTGVKYITSSCYLLEKFSIRNNSRVTDYGIRCLVENKRILLDLNLSGCENITDESLVRISTDCPELESLDISRCEQVTDVGVEAVVTHCRCLKTLRLSGINGITPKCLKKSHMLTTLDVDNCYGLKALTREDLRTSFPNLGGHTVPCHCHLECGKCICHDEEEEEEEEDEEEEEEEEEEDSFC